MREPLKAHVGPTGCVANSTPLPTKKSSLRCTAKRMKYEQRTIFPAVSSIVFTRSIECTLHRSGSVY